MTHLLAFACICLMATPASAVDGPEVLEAIRGMDEEVRRRFALPQGPIEFGSLEEVDALAEGEESAILSITNRQWRFPTSWTQFVAVIGTRV